MNLNNLMVQKKKNNLRICGKKGLCDSETLREIKKNLMNLNNLMVQKEKNIICEFAVKKVFATPRLCEK
jgi:hypothetical protein